MSGTTLVRFVLGGLGALLMAGGLIAVIVGGPAAFVAALWLLGTGAVLLIVAVIEVTRYRSEQAERTALDPGLGGGERGPLETRFRRTDEVFIDPTTRTQMRVFIDPSTGERRYVAEG